MNAGAHALREQYPLVFTAWGLGFPAVVAIAIFLVLVIEYVRVKKWNTSWKNSWEKKHGRPIEQFRTTHLRMLGITRILQWVILACLAIVILLDVDYVRSTGSSWTEGLSFYPLVISTLFVLFLWVLVLVGTALTKMKMRKIDELLERNADS